ncbi:helix-turn-helix domain-containing protein [Clostridium beijerinckii]|nr:AraC family transcriptional regulator [Clostridium beijerinckii]NOW90219.1 AraC-like DNA-binding protein [Clostridium beijerinckii]
MLRESLDITSAAMAVGYESSSQFSREYKRLFGKPPLRDIRDSRKGSGTYILKIVYKGSGKK